MEQLFDLFYACTGVSIDTRTLQKDELFIALKGENFDGNLYAVKAMDYGAKYAIVDNEQYANNKNIFYVENSLVFLQKLANYHRLKLATPILAITGSNGKTTTKELLNQVLNKSKNVYATKGNLNNHIGVPLSLLEIKEQHDFAVIEMGANKPGDIKELCEIAHPNYGLINNVGKAHLEGFGSLQGVIKTKTEMYRYISEFRSENGIVFCDEANELLTKELPINIDVEFYNGTSFSGELLALNPFVEMKYHTAEFNSPLIQTKIIGEYNFMNLLCAAKIGAYFGVSHEDVQNALMSYSPKNNRSQVERTDKGNTLILDAYNANPSSVMSSLNSFAKMDVDGKEKLVILGDMLELGDESLGEHKKIVELTKDLNLNACFVGPIFSSITHDEISFKVKEEAEKFFAEKSLKNHLVLFKGSRGIGLESLKDIF